MQNMFRLVAIAFLFTVTAGCSTLYSLTIEEGGSGDVESALSNFFSEYGFVNQDCVPKEFKDIPEFQSRSKQKCWIKTLSWGFSSDGAIFISQEISGNDLEITVGSFHRESEAEDTVKRLRRYLKELFPTVHIKLKKRNDCCDA